MLQADEASRYASDVENKKKSSRGVQLSVEAQASCPSALGKALPRITALRRASSSWRHHAASPLSLVVWSAFSSATTTPALILVSIMVQPRL
jgi:hypothetical protein